MQWDPFIQLHIPKFLLNQGPPYLQPITKGNVFGYGLDMTSVMCHLFQAKSVIAMVICHADLRGIQKSRTRHCLGCLVLVPLDVPEWLAPVSL